MPELDNELERIHLRISMEWDLPILMKYLASPRADGRQRVVLIKLDTTELGPKMVDAIKNVKNNLLFFKLI
jgi:hypothetical protein